MMGVPSDPKATGAVLPMSMAAAEMATGVPTPAAPSIKGAEAETDQQ